VATDPEQRVGATFQKLRFERAARVAPESLALHQITARLPWRRLKRAILGVRFGSIADIKTARVPLITSGLNGFLKPLEYILGVLLQERRPVARRPKSRVFRAPSPTECVGAHLISRNHTVPCVWSRSLIGGTIYKISPAPEMQSGPVS